MEGLGLNLCFGYRVGMRLTVEFAEDSVDCAGAAAAGHCDVELVLVL